LSFEFPPKIIILVSVYDPLLCFSSPDKVEDPDIVGRRNPSLQTPPLFFLPLSGEEPLLARRGPSPAEQSDKVERENKGEGNSPEITSFHSQ